MCEGTNIDEFCRNSNRRRNHGKQERISRKIDRVDKGVNTVSLAAAIGVSDETVRRWKNGERDILLSQLVKLVDYFQCSLDFLTGRSDTV